MGAKGNKGGGQTPPASTSGQPMPEQTTPEALPASGENLPADPPADPIPADPPADPIPADPPVDIQPEPQLEPSPAEASGDSQQASEPENTSEGSTQTLPPIELAANIILVDGQPIDPSRVTVVPADQLPLPAVEPSTPNLTPQGDNTMADQTPKKRMLKVKVNDAIAARGGAFTCPFTKVTIGSSPIDVEDNKFIRSKINTDELVIVD